MPCESATSDLNEGSFSANTATLTCNLSFSTKVLYAMLIPSNKEMSATLQTFIFAGLNLLGLLAQICAFWPVFCVTELSITTGRFAFFTGGVVVISLFFVLLRLVVGLGVVCDFFDLA